MLGWDGVVGGLGGRKEINEGKYRPDIVNGGGFLIIDLFIILLFSWVVYHFTPIDGLRIYMEKVVIMNGIMGCIIWAQTIVNILNKKTVVNIFKYNKIVSDIEKERKNK